MDSDDVPPSWKTSAEQILKNRWRRILVLGATDIGKSTYCRFLARTLCGAGFETAFVDADVGQKDVGPPATISLAYLARDGGIAQARLASLYFVGAVTPAGHFLPMIVGTRRLADAAEAAFVIIDTTGLIHGIGQVLKAYQIESLRPDIIIGIEKSAELDSILKAHRHYRAIRLRPSNRAAPKSNRHRTAARARAFRSYFEGARDLVMDVAQLIFQRSPLFNGMRLDDPRFLYAERTADGIVAVSRGTESASTRRLRILPAGFERDLLCGLADHNGEGVGLGLVRSIDFERSTITLLSSVPKQRIRVVQFGELRLTPDGVERKYVNKFAWS